MPRRPNHQSPKSHPTKERLRATPFDTVDELESEEKMIRTEVWKRFTEARVIDELLTKPESQPIKEEWEAGLKCSTSPDERENIYRIFSDGRGMKLQLNQEFVRALGPNEAAFLEGVVRAGIEGWGSLYMQQRGLLKRPTLEKAERAKPATRK